MLPSLPLCLSTIHSYWPNFSGTVVYSSQNDWLVLTQDLTATTSLRISHIPSPNWADVSPPEWWSHHAPFNKSLILDPASPTTNWGLSRPIFSIPGPDGAHEYVTTLREQSEMTSQLSKVETVSTSWIRPQSWVAGSQKTGGSASDRVHPSWGRIRPPCVNGLSGYYPQRHAHDWRTR